MGKIKNRTFDEIAKEVFDKAKELKYPREIIEEATILARAIEDGNGNRIAKCVGALYYSCLKHDMPVSRFRLQWEFNISVSTIKKYYNIISNLEREQQSKSGTTGKTPESSA